MFRKAGFLTYSMMRKAEGISITLIRILWEKRNKYFTNSVIIKIPSKPTALQKQNILIKV